MKFQIILSPIELNDSNSLDALRMACGVARENHARIILLHVIPKMVRPDLPGYRDLFPSDEHEVRTQIEKIAGAYLSEGSYEVMVEGGDPAATINLVAWETGADLIVMATHGRRGMAHLIVGSVAEKVLREAPCAVL